MFGSWLGKCDTEKFTETLMLLNRVREVACL
jgi:hypothetical protein